MELRKIYMKSNFKDRTRFEIYFILYKDLLMDILIWNIQSVNDVVWFEAGNFIIQYCLIKKVITVIVMLFLRGYKETDIITHILHSAEVY